MEHLERISLDLAMQQGGVITRNQALELGLSPNQIKWRIASGRWTVIKRSVYQLAKPRDRRDLMRTVLVTWPGAVISHESAAEIYGLPFVERNDHRVIVSHHSRTTHDYVGFVVRRTHDLDGWHVTELDGIRLTTIARTVVDLAADRSARHMGAIVDRLVSDGLLEILELAAVLDATGRRGKPGTTTMREVLEARIGPDHPGSVLERRGRQLIADAGLPLPQSEYPIPWTTGRRFDDAYPERKIAIEWDSRRFHGQLSSFEADRVRDRDAAVHGWVVLRYTWVDVNRHPERVVSALRELLAA
jgi:hypothetical protein